MTKEETTQEVNPTDPEARAVREAAVKYAERVQNGEEPWNDEPDEPEAKPAKAKDPVVGTGDTVVESATSPADGR